MWIHPYHRADEKREVPLFTINQKLLELAKKRLQNKPNIYWIIGAASSGKTTLSQALAEQSHISLYDMDAHIYGSFGELYSAEQHPTNTAWLSAPNPLAWQLALSLDEFDAFNRAASIEHFDLFTKDIEKRGSQQILLVDGGITHPSLLANIIPRENIFCVHINRHERVKAWETSEERAAMKAWIFDLPDPQVKWQKFLELDEAIAQTMVKECESHHIKLFERDAQTSIQALTQMIADYFGITLSS
jgi:hypothetical protein